MPAIWKGSIAFGLVNVPVELRRAVNDHRLSFRMLHEKGHSPIRFKRVREDTGEEVPWNEIVKGYEIEKDEFVVLSDADFKEAAIEQSNTIDIQDFVEEGDIDPRLYESSYYLVPGKGGAQVYALLRDAMAATESVGIGKIIIHKRQHIAEIRAEGKALVLMMLRFANELIDPADYDLPATTKGSAREMQMATELIKSLHSEFDVAKYKDEYEANLMRIIKARAKGKKVHLEGPEKAEKEPRVLDLMERLQKSLAGAKGGRSETKTVKRAPARATTRTVKRAAPRARARRRVSA
jgi:DNA end-binding protein Ku